ncbi:uncharacterized protein LOC141849571 [Brevipalpus obovatus]|uniref:uncharacterized protein LOC141849571 n=1 Tax=Brevipalpus obovatus TaxID=246614 RepID=UPI003D9EA373
MLFTVALLCLVPLSFAGNYTECPIEPIPEIYNDPGWKKMFQFYKDNFKKNYLGEEEDQCRSTIVGIETGIMMIIEMLELVGFNRYLDFSENPLDDFSPSKLTSLMTNLHNLDTSKKTTMWTGVNKCGHQCKDRNFLSLGFPVCLGKCLSH